jgi:hypothetical protein
VIPRAGNGFGDVLGGVSDWLRGLRARPCDHARKILDLLDEAREANEGEPRTLAVLGWLREQILAWPESADLRKGVRP